jgi:hypothetical protein
MSFRLPDAGREDVEHAAPTTAAFDVPAGGSELRLGLRAIGAAPPRAVAAVHAALLLAEAEPLLRWLEDWLDEPLEPAPRTAAAVSPGPGARLHWKSASIAAVVELPWPLLLAGRAAPPELGGHGSPVRWLPLSMALEVAREAVSDAEWIDLRHAGAGLLLGASFAHEGAWPCTLRPDANEAAARLGLAWPARWTCADGRLRWDAGPRVASPPDAPGTVVVRVAPGLSLTPPQLLGWSCERACDCGTEQPVVLVRAREEGDALRGMLVPVGRRLDGTASVGRTGAIARAGWLARVDALDVARPASAR